MRLISITHLFAMISCVLFRFSRALNSRSPQIVRFAHRNSVRRAFALTWTSTSSYSQPKHTPSSLFCKYIDEYDDLDEEIDVSSSLQSNAGSEGSLRLKVRQHVNPLAAKYQAPLELPPDWLQKAFQKPNQPLILDIGCARGSWALEMATKHPDLNFLGLEIRRPVVDLCLKRKDVRKLTNVHFLPSNANVDLQNIFISLQKGDGTNSVAVNAVTIQFPDPHFKSRHKKRRLVNSKFVHLLASHLPAGVRVFCQTDIEDLAIDMFSHFRSYPEQFTHSEGYDPVDLTKNLSIFPVKTEREVATLAKGEKVYRMLFVRSTLPAPASPLESE